MPSAPKCEPALKRHKCSHPGCTYACRSHSQLVTHEKKHTGVKDVACTMCDYTCGRPDQLAIHIQKHTGNLHSCGFCDYTCPTTNALKKHERRHTLEKPVHKIHKCTYPGCSTSCDKEYVSLSNLKLHVMYNHIDRNSVEYKEFRDKKSAYTRARYANNDEFRASCLLRSAFKRFLNTKGGKRAGRTNDIVGCT